MCNDVTSNVELLNKKCFKQEIKPFFSLDPSPFARHSIWALLFGGCIYWLQSGAVDQNMMQRYLSLPNLKAARR